MLSALGGIRTHAQKNQLEVLVEQIAGASIYLRAGTDDGIAVNDTLGVLGASGERSVGALLVEGVTATRSSVSFLADPFPITRGTMLRLRVGSMPESDEEDPAPRDVPAGTSTPSPREGPTVSGRVSAQFNTLGSTTSWASNEDVSLSRRFTSPAVLLRLGVRDLPGGFEFTSNLRGSYRHSPDDLIQPAHSMRVYQASVRKSFERVPLQVQIGRFYNRYENYSGYWDGMLMRYGSDGFGAGVVAGFEPRRANEGVTTDIPKYTAFVDMSRVGERVGYYSDISFHRHVPRNDLPTQTSVGWSQHLTSRRTRLGTDVQVHRDPENNTWALSRLHANGSIPISRTMSVLGRFAFDKPNYLYQTFSLFSYERQQARVGLRYWDRGGNASVHVAAIRVNRGDLSYSLSSSFSIVRTRFLELGFLGAGTIWVLEDQRVFSMVGGINRSFGHLQARGSYRFYKTVGVNSTLQSHTVDAALVFPLGDRIYSTLTARVQHGSNQSANSIFVSLWTSF
jgi:hypothetical protein